MCRSSQFKQRVREVQEDTEQHVSRLQEDAVQRVSQLHQDSEHRVTLLQASTGVSRRSIYIELQVEGVPVNFLVDTGSSVSIIMEDIYMKHFQGMKALRYHLLSLYWITLTARSR